MIIHRFMLSVFTQLFHLSEVCQLDVLINIRATERSWISIFVNSLINNFGKTCIFCRALEP